MPLQTGQPAPDFSLRDQHGRTVTLSELRGRKAAVVMFFPFAFSSVCTGELGAVRDRLPSLASDHAEIVAVSCDHFFSLRALADRDGLEFPLLSDFWPHGAVARAYDSFDEQGGFANRSTFIVDTAGVLRWQVHNAMRDARDLDACARALRDLTNVPA